MGGLRLQYSMSNTYGGAVPPNGTPTLDSITVTDTTAQVNFTCGATNQDGTYIYYSLTSGGTYTLGATVTGSGTHGHLTGLTENTTYYVKVVHYKGSKLSSYSNIVSAKTLEPAIIRDGNTIAWYDIEDLTTLTKDINNLVSRWNDKLLSGNDLIQANDTNKLVYSIDGLTSDGVDNFMQTANFTYNQPCMIYLVFKQITWTTDDAIFSGNNTTTYLRQTLNAPGLKARAGTYSNQNSDLPLDEFGIIRVLFNGANSKIQVNLESAITGNFGAGVMGGICLAALNAATSRSSNIQIKEGIFRIIADTIENEVKIVDYLANKYSITKAIQPSQATSVNLSVTIPDTTNYTTFINVVTDIGANVFIDFGDGEVLRAKDTGSTSVYISKQYAEADTYPIKIFGELSKVKQFRTGSTEIWNIDVTEFEKTENIEYLLCGSPLTLSGTITNLISLKEWWISAPVIPNEDGLIGNIDSLTNLEVLECQGEDGNYPFANITGNFANLPNLIQHCVVHKITGDITGCTKLKYISWGYVNGGSTDGVVQNTQTPIRIYGDISNMTDLWYISLNPGANTITGNTTSLVNMETFSYVPPLMVKPSSVNHMPKLSFFQPPSSWLLSEAEVNQYLADIWANREVVRTYSKNTVGEPYGIGGRYIDLSKNVLSSAPTGQGITDKNNLLNTVSPAIPGNGEKWTIITN